MRNLAMVAQGTTTDDAIFVSPPPIQKSRFCASKTGIFGG